jgi:hypothetical protein
VRSPAPLQLISQKTFGPGKGKTDHSKKHKEKRRPRKKKMKTKEDKHDDEETGDRRLEIETDR